MTARKVYLVILDNGLEYSDHDNDIVGIYNLDKLREARDEAIRQLKGMDDLWYRNASVQVWRVWIDKALDFTAGDKVYDINLRSL